MQTHFDLNTYAVDAQGEATYCMLMHAERSCLTYSAVPERKRMSLSAFLWIIVYVSQCVSVSVFCIIFALLSPLLLDYCCA